MATNTRRFRILPLRQAPTDEAIEVEDGPPVAYDPAVKIEFTSTQLMCRPPIPRYLADAPGYFEARAAFQAKLPKAAPKRVEPEQEDALAWWRL